MNEPILKYFLILYFLLYYGVLFTLNPYLVFKRTGKNPYVLGNSKGVINFTERSIKAAGMLIPIVLLIYIFSEDVYRWLVPIQYLEENYFNYCGIVLMAMGFVICLTTQYYMRNSWRIGIELNSEIKLVTAGIFKYSRNPFFLGTFLSYMGFFLVIPNILTFAVGVVYLFLIQIQVRLEEEYLLKLLGNNYVNYCLIVRRWI
jgi:protein-S-isoprenylcysteine O-methyltransferase Ste14